MQRYLTAPDLVPALVRASVLAFGLLTLMVMAFS